MADENENTTQDEDNKLDLQSEFLLLDNFKFEVLNDQNTLNVFIKYFNF